MKVFSCVGYVHLSPSERSKIGAQAKKCIFLGYGNDAFWYKLWDYEGHKVIRSRDIIFNENELYKDRNKTQVEDVGSSNIDKELYIDIDDVSGKNMVQEEHDVADGGEVQEGTSAAVGVTPIVPQEVRRSSRTPKPNPRYALNYLLLTDGVEPEDIKEALAADDSGKWQLAMEDEINSLEEDGTWVLVKLPRGKKALHNKWVYRMKSEANGDIRYKERLVVKGFQQKPSVDYNEIFSPVVKMTTIRVVLSLVASEDLYLEQLDVKTTFLHGNLDEEIYMKHPEGFIVKGKEEMVCKLKKSLYGLKQARRQWYKKFDNFMHRGGYSRCNADHCCYFKRCSSDYIILLLYVDDMLVSGTSLQEVENLKKQLSSEFAVKDLGEAKQILGMRIIRDIANGVLMLSQADYIERVLKRFNMENAKPVSSPIGSQILVSSMQCAKTNEEKEYMANVPYSSAIGSLMYAMVCMRPDIAHAVGVVSRYASNPGKQHWEAVKWILRYLRGNTNVSLCYGKGGSILRGYVDADFKGDVDKR